MQNHEFRKLIAGVREGDQEAAARLVADFEPYLLRVIRMRLDGGHLRSMFDSEDIWQSVLARFFASARNGEFQLETPTDLVNLLATMARNNLTSKWRANRGGVDEISARRNDLIAAADPENEVERMDLAAAIRARLSVEEMWLFDQHKVLGRSWESIGREMQKSPDELRMRLARALARVRRQMENQFEP